MNLKIKFCAISALSIFTVVVLIYESFSTLGILEEATKQVESAHTSVLNQAEADRLHDAIKGDVGSAVSNHTLGNKDGLQESLDNLKEHTTDYISAINSAVALKLPSDIHNNFTNIQSNVDNFIQQAYLVVNNIDGNSVKDNLTALDITFSKINNVNDILTDQVTKLAQNLKLEGELNTKRAIKNFALISTLATIFALFVPIFIVRNIFTPQNQMINVMNKVLSGDTNQEVPFLSRTDELGSVAKVIENVRHNMVEKQELEISSKQQAKQAEEDRRNNLLAFANSFEKTIKGIVDMVASAATEMDATAKELKQSANNAQKETKQLSTASIQTNANVQGVSKATNEFTNAVNEISSQVTNSREYARRASLQTDQVNTVMHDLETKANAITGIIDIINNITSQIDLLALNATIEAARAGDMGKGFAVVANEVKALATQTSKATEQINIQISGIQSSTNKAVSSIQDITESVKTINQNSASIASAVEEQNATSSYIAESISQVASMSNIVSSSVEKVSTASAHSGASSGQMVTAADDLLKQVSLLQNEVNKFLSSLRTA